MGADPVLWLSLYPGVSSESVRLFDKEKASYQMKNIADDREAVLDEFAKKLNEELVRIGDPWGGA